jgi:hypothetical protein
MAKTLHEAADEGSVDEFSRLIESGVDVNAKNQKGLCVLAYICSQRLAGHQAPWEEMVHLLMKRPELDLNVHSYLNFFVHEMLVDFGWETPWLPSQ